MDGARVFIEINLNKFFTKKKDEKELKIYIHIGTELNFNYQFVNQL
jgi:hypothetical protein